MILSLLLFKISARAGRNVHVVVPLCGVMFAHSSSSNIILKVKCGKRDASFLSSDHRVQKVRRESFCFESAPDVSGAVRRGLRATGADGGGAGGGSHRGGGEGSRQSEEAPAVPTHRTRRPQRGRMERYASCLSYMWAQRVFVWMWRSWTTRHHVLVVLH